MKTKKQVLSRANKLLKRFKKLHREWEHENQFIHSAKARFLKKQLKLIANEYKVLEWVLK